MLQFLLHVAVFSCYSLQFVVTLFGHFILSDRLQGLEGVEEVFLFCFCCLKLGRWIGID